MWATIANLSLNCTGTAITANDLPFRASFASLPPALRRLPAAEAYPVQVAPALEALAREADRLIALATAGPAPSAR